MYWPILCTTFYRAARRKIGALTKGGGMKAFKVIGLLALVLTLGVRADHVGQFVEIGQPTVGGTGCPSGSVAVSLDPTTGDLSVLFDSFTVEAEGSTRIARKACSLAIPITLPAGKAVSVLQSRLEGFNVLSEGTTAILTSEYFLAGQKGNTVTERFDGELLDSFTVEETVPVLDSSGVGEVLLRINTSLRVRSNSYGDYAASSIDAMGVDGGLKFQLALTDLD